jgi:hypothetical protein
MALMINLKLNPGVEPFRAEDFLGTGRRELREVDRRAGEIRAAELRRKLAVMRPQKPGEPEPEGLPSWARSG